jgi:hypothetical protein
MLLGGNFFGALRAPVIPRNGTLAYSPAPLVSDLGASSALSVVKSPCPETRMTRPPQTSALDLFRYFPK